MGFVNTQLFVKLPVPTTSYAGKTVIVTGSNVGLGLEAAHWFTKLNASKVILAVRSTEKGEAAKRSIEATTKCSPKTIEVWPLDMCSYASVEEFASRASKNLSRLDVLLLNAGVATGKWTMAEDNELSITVNVISTLLLAFLMLPKMKETASRFNTTPNLTIVSSGAHAHVDFAERDAEEGIFNRLNDEGKTDMTTRYPTSKLLPIYIVREMAERRKEYPVTVNLVNPGLCESELAREGNWQVRVMKALLARTTEVGSRTLVHGASAGKETHGVYLSECVVGEPAAVVRGEKGRVVQKRLWDELVVKLEKIVPSVTGNL
ncbi:short chain dehydrogenase [Rhexocercosporidium sp. MPI-PUGE-AT-0058]|nr:short chain dehydrogenase [Rhexocercosporidium sp. MPI-PUGE-AT-0058]